MSTLSRRTLMTTALAAGESQFHVGSVTGATLGAMAEGSDAVFVAGLINKLTGTFMVGNKIKSPVDLKGKTLGVQVSTGHERYATKYLVPSGIELKTYSTQDEANNDLAAGRLDYVQADSTALDAFLKTEQGQQFIQFANPLLLIRRILPSSLQLADLRGLGILLRLQCLSFRHRRAPLRVQLAESVHIHRERTLRQPSRNRV